MLRRDLIHNLQLLIEEKKSRQEVAKWASININDDIRISDQILWEVLDGLGAADLVSTDRPYLYEVSDFKD